MITSHEDYNGPLISFVFLAPVVQRVDNADGAIFN